MYRFAFAYQAPGITTLVLLFYIAAWAVAAGALRIVMAVRLKEAITGEWLMLASGAVSILFGVWVMARPGPGALALIFIIGIWAIAVGGTLIASSLALLAYRAKNKVVTT